MAEEHEKKSKLKIKIPKLGVWQISTIILGISIILMAVLFSMNGYTLTDLLSSNSKDQVSLDTVKFLNENFGTEAQVKTIETENGVYHITLDVQGEEVEVYTTRDGSMIFPLVIDTTETQATTQEPEQTQQVAEVAKAEKPNVELFVMSHCPYGTQMEKGVLPVVELLGDKIDFEIKFVYYAMHGETEINEQLNQYCIQKGQTDKYIDYLSCFLKEGDGETCLTETKIDTSALTTCVEETDGELGITAKFEDQSTWLSGRYPLFDTSKADNEKYGVGGSPTLVINGQQAQSGRDSASILATVCASFEDAPAECEQTLSAAAPSPGFGYEGTGSATAATCG